MTNLKALIILALIMQLPEKNVVWMKTTRGLKWQTCSEWKSQCQKEKNMIHWNQHRGYSTPVTNKDRAVLTWHQRVPIFKTITKVKVLHYSTIGFKLKIWLCWFNFLRIFKIGQPFVKKITGFFGPHDILQNGFLPPFIFQSRTLEFGFVSFEKHFNTTHWKTHTFLWNAM